MDGVDPTERDDSLTVDADEMVIPAEHLCGKDLTVQPGDVDGCCADYWRDNGVLAD